MSERGAAASRGDQGLVVVITTLSGEEDAERLVHQLLDERLIACGNIVPGLTSLYRWEGVVERAREVLVLMKTPPDQVEPLFARVRELHPYDVPELVALSADVVSPAYLEWVRRETNEVSR